MQGALLHTSVGPWTTHLILVVCKMEITAIPTRLFELINTECSELLPA